jgi:hypothetical protein
VPTRGLIPQIIQPLQATSHWEQRPINRTLQQMTQLQTNQSQILVRVITLRLSSLDQAKAVQIRTICRQHSSRHCTRRCNHPRLLLLLIRQAIRVPIQWGTMWVALRLVQVLILSRTRVQGRPQGLLTISLWTFNSSLFLPQSSTIRRRVRVGDSKILRAQVLEAAGLEVETRQ